MRGDDDMSFKSEDETLMILVLICSSLLPTMDKLRSVNDGVDLLESWDYPV